MVSRVNFAPCFPAHRLRLFPSSVTFARLISLIIARRRSFDDLAYSANPSKKKQDRLRTVSETFLRIASLLPAKIEILFNLVSSISIIYPVYFHHRTIAKSIEIQSQMRELRTDYKLLLLLLTRWRWTSREGKISELLWMATQSGTRAEPTMRGSDFSRDSCVNQSSGIRGRKILFHEGVERDLCPWFFFVEENLNCCARSMENANPLRKPNYQEPLVHARTG